MKNIFLRTLCISLGFVSFHNYAWVEKAAREKVAEADDIDRRFGLLEANSENFTNDVTAFSSALTNLKNKQADMKKSVSAVMQNSMFMKSFFESVVNKIIPIDDHIAKLERIKNAISTMQSKITNKSAIETSRALFNTQRLATQIDGVGQFGMKTYYKDYEQYVRAENQQMAGFPPGYVDVINTFKTTVKTLEGEWKDVGVIADKLKECTTLMTGDMSDYVKIVNDHVKVIKDTKLDTKLDVPIVLEITAFNFGVWNSAKADRTISESNVAAVETAAKNITLNTVSDLSTKVTTLVDSIKNIFTQGKTDLDTFKNFNPTQVSFSGKAFGIAFTGAKLYEVVDAAVHCFGGYVKLSDVTLVPDVVSFKALHLFHTNCSAMKMNAFKDSDLLTIFKNIAIKDGTFFRTDVDFPLLRKIPYISSVFKDPLTMSGVVTTPAESFKGTTLNYVPSGATISIPEVGSLTLTSIGVEIVAGLTAKLPIKGKITLFKQDFITEVTPNIDPKNLSALVTGQYVGDVAFLDTGITLKNPGLAANISAAGVTGAGVKGDITFGGKTISVMTYGNLTGADLAISGSISSISLTEVISSLKNVGVPETALNTIRDLLPNVSLSNCTVSVAPKDLTLFGETYKKGVTVKGSATFLGKTCTVNITASKTSVYADIEVDSLDFAGIVKFSGNGTDKLRLVLDTAGGGFYCKAKVELLASILGKSFSGIKSTCDVNIAPLLLEVKNFSLDLPGSFGSCKLYIKAGVTAGVASGWEFEATLSQEKATSLTKSLNDFISKISACF